MKMGVMVDFRNPEPWRKPFPEFYQSQLELVSKMEQLGIDNCWLTEHHFVEDGYNPATLPMAAAIAARTSRIRIGTFVLLMPFHNPVRLAEDVTCIDILSNGRFDLGVGQGYRAGEFEQLKIPRKERAPRMAEGIDLVHQLMTKKNVTFEGRFTQVKDMTIYPRPVHAEGPPIWIGCRTEKATERAARMGFHMMATIGPDPAPKYREQLKQAGRDPKAFNIAQLRMVYCAPTADQAWAETAPHLHHMLKLYGVWLSEANDAEGDAAMTEIPSPDQIRHSPYAEGMMIGTPDEVARKMEKFRKEYDCTHFVMGTQMPGADPKKSAKALELFAKEVMPAFQTK